MSARRQPRSIVAEANWKVDGEWKHWRRRYARLDTAIPRIVQYAVDNAFPGDVIAVYHEVTGLEIGTVKAGVGTVTCKWLWDLEPELGGSSK